MSEQLSLSIEHEEQLHALARHQRVSVTDLIGVWIERAFNEAGLGAVEDDDRTVRLEPFECDNPENYTGGEDIVLDLVCEDETPT